MSDKHSDIARKYDLLTRIAMDGYWVMAADGTVMFANAIACSMYGYTFAEMVGRNLREFEATESDDVLRQHMHTIMDTGHDRFETRHVRKDGSSLDVEVSTSYLPQEQLFLAFTRDISGRKLLEARLKASEERFRTITELSPDIISILDREGRLAFNSRAALAIHGYTDEDMEGRDTFDLIHPDDRDHVAAAFSSLLSGEQQSVIVQYRYLNKDNSYRWMEATARNHLDNPHIQGVVVISRDISRRKQQEDEQAEWERHQHHFQKLESLGVLAGGIAHDFNNILTGIIGNISYARTMLGADNRVAALLLNAEKAAGRAADLSNQLLTFAKGGQPVKKVVSLKRLVAETTSFVLHGSNVSSVTDAPHDDCLIDADEGLLSQALNNLIINAAQAMPGGGTIRIRIEHRELSAGNVMGLAAGRYLRFAIADTGCGIPAENLERIFDPYFTTKAGGSGLGLATTYAVVIKHGGYIGVRSVVDEGAEFEILLPTCEGATGQDEAAVGQVPLPAPDRLSVLVMDDEQMIRDMATFMLEQAGHRVCTCGNGAEAVELYRAACESGTPYALAILDLTVPGGVGGVQAARQIVSFDPAARLVVSSGYSDDTVMADYARYGFRAILKKPYKADELFRVIAEVMQGAA